MIPQICKVRRGPGGWTCEGSAPYPIAQVDRKHALVDGVVRNRKTGRRVYTWGDGSTTRERT